MTPDEVIAHLRQLGEHYHEAAKRSDAERAAQPSEFVINDLFQKAWIEYCRQCEDALIAAVELIEERQHEN